MKNLNLFLILFFLAFIISCTIQRAAFPVKKKEPNVPAFKQPEFKPVVVVSSIPAPAKPVKYGRDTIIKEIIKYVPVTDTSALTKWFNKMAAEMQKPRGEEERAEFLRVLDGYKKALNESNALRKTLSVVKKEKQEGENKVEATQKAIYDVPMILYIMLVVVVLCIIARQQYLKTKLERQIKDLKCKNC